MCYKHRKIDTHTKILSKKFNLQSLKNRPFNNNIILLYKLLNNELIFQGSWPKFLFIQIPKHALCYTYTFYNQPQKLNYSYYVPINRISLNGNTLNNFDFFPSKLKEILKKDYD